MVVNWIRQLDELLRGERVRGELLLKGHIDLRLRTFVPIAVALGAVYGFFMGWYALFGRDTAAIQQLVASTVKLPALFLLTLCVTFPSLYVFNALVGCRMSFPATIRVLVGAIVVNLAVAASLGPILAFFTVSTRSYVFIVLLNVALLGVGGLVSLSFLLKALQGLARSRAFDDVAREEQVSIDAGTVAPPTSSEPARSGEPQDAKHTFDRAQLRVAMAAERRFDAAVLRRERAANFILFIWVTIYVLVGTQMGWILRPFIGSPGTPFEWFRPREGSFISGVAGALRGFFGA